MVDCVYHLSCEEPPLGVTGRHVPQSVDEIEDEPLDILHAFWIHMRHHLQSIGDSICDARENDAVRLPRGSRDFGLFNIQDDLLLQLTMHTSSVTSKVLCRLFPRACLMEKRRITVDIRRYLTKRVLFVVQSWVVGEVIQCSDESAESRGNNVKLWIFQHQCATSSPGSFARLVHANYKPPRRSVAQIFQKLMCFSQ